MMRITFMLISACTQDNELKGRTDVVGPDDWPKIVVTPDYLDFGDLSYGETVERSFTIGNEGTEHSELIVDDVAISTGGEAGFILLDAPNEPFKLRYGEEETVSAAFTALEPGDAIGEVMITSNDTESSATPVQLDGAGIMPQLVIDPDPYEYGEITVGCDRPGTFMLTNAGNDVLTMDRIDSLGLEFVMIERPILPSSLLPSDTAVVYVDFVPKREGIFNGTLSVASNDPRGEHSVVQSGSGIMPGNYTDSFDIPSRGAIDLMFVVDQSFSMTDDQVSLAANAVAFADALASVTDDWQILVASGDDGCNAGGILRADTPDYVALFSDAIQVGDDSDRTEAGIYRSYLAATQTGAGDCNEGFVRPDALLHIVYVSDEYDGSEEQTRVPWYDYIEAMRTLKGASYLVKASAVVGDVPSGCDSPTGHAGPGTGYADAVEETHGGLISICSDWSGSVSTVATFGVSRDTYPLSHMPDVATIQPYIDGVLRTTDWHYMSDSNTVVFTGAAIPQSGNVVEIAFTVPYTCL